MDRAADEAERLSASERKSPGRTRVRLGASCAGCDTTTRVRPPNCQPRCRREERGANDERRPLRGGERGQVRIGKEDQQPFRALPDESEGKQPGADSEKQRPGNFG